MFVKFFIMLVLCSTALLPYSSIDESLVQLHSKVYIKNADYYKDVLLIKNTNQYTKIKIGCEFNTTSKRGNELCQGTQIEESSLYKIRAALFNGRVSLPHKWEEDTGTAVYVIHVKSELDVTVLSNKNWLADESFRLWALQEDNLKLIGEGGIVSSDPNIHSPYHTNALYSFENNMKPFYYVIEVSSFFKSQGALGEVFITDSKTGKKQFYTYIWNEWFLAGFILLAGLYHIVLYLLNPRVKSPLWFGLFCISICIRGLLTSRTFELMYDFSPGLFEARVRTEYLTVTVPTIFFLYYIHHALAQVLSRYALIVLSTYAFIASCYILVGNHHTFYQYLTFIQLVPASVALLALGSASYVIYYNKDKHTKYVARCILFTGIFFIATVFHDILATQDILPYRGQWVSIGLLVFIIGQAYVISYKSAQSYKTSIELSTNLKGNVDKQIKKLTKIYTLSKSIQDAASMDKLWFKFLQTMNDEFNLHNFTLYLRNENNQLDLYRCNTSIDMPTNTQELLSENEIDIEHHRSLHGKVMKKGTSVFFPRLLKAPTSPIEDHNRSILKMNSVYIIPIKVEGETFALFSFTDSDYQRNQHQNVKRLTANQRNQIELICSHTSAAIYQIIQKDTIKENKNEIEEAYKELRIQEKKLARIESNAHLSTLAAYLAHEVNNPLNYISTGIGGVSLRADNLRKKINSVIADDEESQEFKQQLDQEWDKIFESIMITKSGLNKISDVIQEVRNITALDGLKVTRFNIMQLIKDELNFIMNKEHTDTVEVRVNGKLIQDIQTNSDSLVYNAQTSADIVRRCIRTMISEGIHFAQTSDSKPALDININYSFGSDSTKMYEITFRNNGRSIKTERTADVFDSNINKGHGTELIGIPSVRALITKVNGTIILNSKGVTDGWVSFSLFIPESI